MSLTVIIYGYVIDFLDVYVGDWHWPAFNVADSAITIGAALMLLEAFFEQRDDDAAGRDNAAKEQSP